jgi:hypothetical protein
MVKPAITPTLLHASLPRLTVTPSTNLSTQGIVPSATTYASATTNNGGHVDHTI